jgi:hypothetical protein
MSKSPRIAKLEALLERIRSRAGAPRPTPAPPVAAAAAASSPTPPAPPPPQPRRPEVEPRLQPASPPPAPVAELIEVDVQETVSDTVIGMTVEEVPLAESFESRERLVAAEPVMEEGLADDVLPEEVVAEEVVIEAAVVEEVVIEAAVVAEPAEESPSELLSAIEEVEEAPLSSRRPVAPEPEERLADMAFGAEEPSPPRHTPPPESGRLPAAPALEFDGDVTGVREASPMAVVEQVRARELSPAVTGAPVAPNDAVAEIVGAAQRFAPATFAALLDASLAL